MAANDEYPNKWVWMDGVTPYSAPFTVPPNANPNVVRIIDSISIDANTTNPGHAVFGVWFMYISTPSGIPGSPYIGSLVYSAAVNDVAGASFTWEGPLALAGGDSLTIENTIIMGVLGDLGLIVTVNGHDL